MKRLLYFLILSSCFTACKKNMQEDLLQNEAASFEKSASRDIGPVPAPPYKWQEMPYAIFGPSFSLHNTNQIIEVNGLVYCLMAGPMAKLYKLNNNTKRWEISHDFAYYPQSQYLFSYQSKVYFGMNKVNGSIYENLFSIDINNGQTSLLASFPGRPVAHAAFFVIADKAYIVSGENSLENTESQFWEYNISSNQWTDKGSIPLSKRAAASVFVANNKAYIGLGYDYTFLNGQKTLQFKNDWKQFDPLSAQWTSLENFPAFRRADAKGFVINNSIYLGFGNNNSDYFIDFWKYNISSNSWSQQANYQGTMTNFAYSVGTFAIGSTGYVVKGEIKEFWRFSNSPFVVFP